MKKGELITIVSCVFLLVAGVVGFKIAAGKGGKEAETSAAVEPAVSADEEELAGLRDENAELKDKMEKLERAVERLTAAPKKPQESPASKDADEAKPVADSPEPAVEKETNPAEQLLKKWEAEGLAFPSGDYAKGRIPEGYYIWIKSRGRTLVGAVSLYGAADIQLGRADQSQFGYMKVLSSARVSHYGGTLIKASAVINSPYPNALKFFCAYHEVENWNYSGMYQIGRDIPPGSYLVESNPNKSFASMRWFKSIPGSVGDYRIELVKGSRVFEFVKGEFVYINDGFIKKQ